MQPEPFNVGTFTRSVLLHVARESGAFRDVGLDVHESLVTSSPAQFKSLDQGDFDLVFTSPDNVLAYHFLEKNPLAKKIPLRILSALDGGLGLSLNVGPGVTDVQEVRGRVVGVDVPQSGFAFVAYELLARCGLGPGTYELESLGSTPTRTAALIEGSCAATVLNAGNEIRARGHGCTTVSAVGDLGPYVGTVIAAVPTNVESTLDRRQRFCDVVLRTSSDILAGHRTSEVVDAAMALLELNEDQAREHYNCLTKSASGLVANGVVTLDAIETLVNLRRTYMPAPELDGILASMDEVLMGAAKG